MFIKSASITTLVTWAACIIATILAVPFIAMHLLPTVYWTPLDFIATAALLAIAATAIIFSARKLPVKRLPIATLIIAVIIIYVWTELAVGIFTKLGN